MKTRYLYATDPDGDVHKRRTHRDYSHAVMVFNDVRGDWGTWGYNGRYDLAVKSAGQARQVYRRVVIVPVTDEKPTS